MRRWCGVRVGGVVGVSEGGVSEVGGGVLGEDGGAKGAEGGGRREGGERKGGGITGHPQQRGISPRGLPLARGRKGGRGDGRGGANTTTHGPSFQVKTCENPPERTCASASWRVKGVIFDCGLAIAVSGGEANGAGGSCDDGLGRMPRGVLGVMSSSGVWERRGGRVS